MARKAGQIVARGASTWLVRVYPKIRTYSFAIGVTGGNYTRCHFSAK